MTLGINRALDSYQNSLQEHKSYENKPCIFLSHKSEDKENVEKIGEYIKKRGLDIYLDKYDNDLQQADRTNNDKAVTKCIQKGISNCTHIMCILSRKTVNSWWVPYELGFGERSGKDIMSLKLKEISSSEIPSYIRIRPCLENQRELDSFIDELLREYGINIYMLTEQKSYNAASYNNYELSDVLDR